MQRIGRFGFTGDWSKRWGGVYRISRKGIAFNEGARPFNFNINWRNGLFLYVFLNGRRWSKYLFRSK